MSKQRLTSLDAFRGFTVAAMIMVNFPGNSEHVFFTLKHSVWNALSFTDLVAPFFLFIVGVSIHFAYSSLASTDKPKPYQKIIWRAVKIYAVGMILNAMPTFDLTDLRWTGTLHRIAVVFMICSFIALNTNWKQQLWIVILLMIGYWYIMTCIPYPGECRVMLEPGKNIAAYVDSLYLPGKMWQGTWDPEGLLSVIPCCCTTLLGTIMGRIIKTDMPVHLRLNYFMLVGVAMSVLGYFVGLSFPVNENIWSSSFVLVTAGFATLVFACMYFIFDVLPFQQYAKVGVVFGINAISAYVLGDVLGILFFGTQIGDYTINMHFFNLLTDWGMLPELASWLYALFFVAVVFLPCWTLYKRGIIIKL